MLIFWRCLQKSENAHPAGQETKGESQASAGSAGDAAAAASDTQQEEPKGVWGKIKAWFAVRPPPPPCVRMCVVYLPHHLK